MDDHHDTINPDITTMLRLVTIIGIVIFYLICYICEILDFLRGYP